MSQDVNASAATDGSAAFLKLVDDFGNAAMQVGLSNSGLCIDVSAGTDWARMQKIRKTLKDGIVRLQDQVRMHQEDEKLKTTRAIGE